MTACGGEESLMMNKHASSGYCLGLRSEGMPFPQQGLLLAPESAPMQQSRHRVNFGQQCSKVNVPENATPCKAKIRNFHAAMLWAVSHHQHIGGLEVPVHNSVAVQVGQTPQELPQETLDSIWIHVPAARLLPVMPYQLIQVMLGIVKCQRQAWILRQDALLTPEPL